MANADICIVPPFAVARVSAAQLISTLPGFFLGLINAPSTRALRAVAGAGESARAQQRDQIAAHFTAEEVRELAGVIGWMSGCC